MSTRTMPMYRRAEYARLLERAQPAVIHTEEQNETYLQTLGQLLARKEKQSVAEREMVALLTLLIENFEAEHYALPKAGPLAVLRFLMEQHDLKQKDLANEFGTPSIVSEVMNGKRELNKEQIRRLSERFHVSPEIFF